jgi:alpha-L-fucosidase 2
MRTTLRYNGVATEWIEGLPLGNGANGMMIYGEAKKETFLLNHEWMWTTRCKKRFYTAEKIEELTELVKNKNPKKFQEVFERTVTRETACNAFQPFCTLCVSLLKEGEAVGYQRELNLEKAVATLSYEIEGNKVTYEAFCDINSPIMRIQMNSTMPVDLALNYTRAESSDCKWSQSYQNGDFRFEGVLDDVHFLAITRIISDGEMDADSMCLKNATKVEFRIVLANTLMTDSLEDFTQKALEDVKPFAETELEHSRVFSEQFNRCRLDLKHNDTRTTDELFEEGQKNSKPSLAWYELVADMARYILMSSSQRGTLPCNLQGVWNPEVKPEWDGGYTTDMNLQMYYWAANKMQLFESQFSLFDWIDSKKERMQSLAKDIFGVEKAFYIPQYTDCFIEPTCWKGTEGAFQTLWGGAAS